MILRNCPICFSLCRETKRLHKCNHCGHGYREFSGDTIEFHDQVFREEFQISENEVADGEVTDAFHENRKQIVESRLTRIKKYLRKSDSIIDIGGGAGTFANAASKYVDSVEITEVNQAIANDCNSRGIKATVVELNEMDVSQQYDVVFAWHVLEHIEDIQTAAVKLKKLFKRFLIIEIPKERGSPEQFDGHHHFFSDQSLQMLFGDLVIRQYGEGVQKPSRLVVFEKTRGQARIQTQFGKE